MLKWNDHWHVLQIEEHTYDLQDVAEPELYRDVFPYDSVPRVPFNMRRVPMMPPEDIWITDTTFRDGQQARPPYTVKQIVDLYEMLHRLGGTRGYIRQCEFFLYTKKDKEAVARCRELGYRYPEITGWIRANKEDFHLVKEMGLKETGILTSCSDYHIFLKLKKKRSEAMAMYLDIVKAALDEGIIPRCHFEDATRADFYGFVVPFAQRLMELSREYGMPVKIRVCDTLGLGVPYSGAAMPRSVPGLIYGLIRYSGIPSEWIEWHGHNDFCKVLANAATAWLYGCAVANGTLLGLGERTGNAPVEGLVMEHISLKGDDNAFDTTVITEIADYYRKEIKLDIPPDKPFVGSHFNVTCAGIHADGILKNEEVYNIFDTRKILGRPPGVAITDKSGVAGICLWVANRFDRTVDKKHPGILKVKEEIDRQFEEGRVTVISDEEMLELLRAHVPELFEPHVGAGGSRE